MHDHAPAFLLELAKWPAEAMTEVSCKDSRSLCRVGTNRCVH